MRFNIFDISTVKVSDFEFYFCDANVWIATLKYFEDKDIKNYDRIYADFLNNIIIANDNPELLIKPKIILTSLVLSETINAYLRDVAMKNFFDGKTIQGSFKDNYRDNVNSDYERQLKNFVDDLTAFEEYIVFYDDNFHNSKSFNLLKNMPLKTDFNDFYYYNLLKGKNIPIITHDSDFLFQNIPIITCNKKMLREK